MTKETSWHG